MNDRELLELAAKAADVFLTPEKLAEVFPEGGWCETDEPYFKECGSMVGTVVWYGSDGVELGGTEKLEWDPLNDDGDALRLAVKLGMQITPGTYNKDEFTAFRAGHGEAHESRHFQQDEFAATRRAIVRAAAAIGEELKASPQSPHPAPGNTAR